MSTQDNRADDMALAAIYEICVDGHLDKAWSDWFGGLTLTHTCQGGRCLIGSVVDQAALFGLLRKVRDAGLSLLSVRRVRAK